MPPLSNWPPTAKLKPSTPYPRSCRIHSNRSPTIYISAHERPAEVDRVERDMILVDVGLQEREERKPQLVNAKKEKMTCCAHAQPKIKKNFHGR